MRLTKMVLAESVIVVGCTRQHRIVVKELNVMFA